MPKNCMHRAKGGLQWLGNEVFLAVIDANGQDDKMKYFAQIGTGHIVTNSVAIAGMLELRGMVDKMHEMGYKRFIIFNLCSIATVEYIK